MFRTISSGRASAWCDTRATIYADAFGKLGANPLWYLPFTRPVKMNIMRPLFPFIIYCLTLTYLLGH